MNKKSKLGKSFLWPVFFLLAGNFSVAFAQTAEPVEVDITKADQWNKFADSLQTLSDHLIATSETRQENSTGGYGGVTADLEFYREVKSFDKKSGNLVSQVQRETKKPGRLHTIEVYIYDEKGRIKRDYIAAYLPVHRNAPFQTLIDMYRYSDGLQGYRQFDASDVLLYEQCRGTYKNRDVFISLEDYEIPNHPGQIEDEFLRTAYNICFKSMPSSAGPHLDPLHEMTLSGTN